MKIVKRQLLSIIYGLILCGLVMSTEVQNKKNKNSANNQQIIRPNLADLNSQMKIIKPLIERPYIPQEVERLSEPKRKIFDDASMTKATLVGQVQNKGGLEEKPSMYSTVITSHPTSVIHPVPQPLNYLAQPGATNAFAATQPEAPAPLTPGAYSIPVKIQGGAISDPTLSGYETPNFIHKGEKVTPSKNIHDPPQLSIKARMEEAIQNDIQTFISQFDNAKDKEERIKILLDGKNRLNQESKALVSQIQAEIKELLQAKEVAVKLYNLLGNYENKLRKNELSKLKLADEVTIKNILRNKLHRELQGFRTSPGEYKELEMVNPDDITNIIRSIKLKLGQ